MTTPTVLEVLATLRVTIDALRDELREHARRAASEAARATAWREAEAHGDVAGTLDAMTLDLAAGRVDVLPQHRAELLRAFHTSAQRARFVAQHPELLREAPGDLDDAVSLALAAGLAARDATRALDGTIAAEQLAHRLTTSLGEIVDSVRPRLTAPAALFWLEPAHRLALRRCQAAHARLALSLTA